jgi:hypothetical protein
VGFVWCERNWVAMFVCLLVGHSAVHPKMYMAHPHVFASKRKIDVVYGVEPNVEVLSGLKKRLVKYGMVKKYKISPFGVEESEHLAEAGVTFGSIDTIVCISLACGKAIDDR